MVITDLSYEDEFLQFYPQDHLFIVQFKQRAMAVVTDLVKSELLFTKLSQVEQHPQIQAVLMVNHAEALSEEEYEKFLRTYFPVSDSTAAKQRELMRRRQVNILNQFIALCLNSSKLTIAGLQGSIATPFFGAALAMDLRFASQDVQFSLKHLQRGIGAVPFFLPRMIGYSRAKELLFCSRQISAEEALAMHLVNRVLPADSFIDSLLEGIGSLSCMEPEVVKNVKYLIEPDLSELDSYLERETKIGLI